MCSSRMSEKIFSQIFSLGKLNEQIVLEKITCKLIDFWQKVRYADPTDHTKIITPIPCANFVEGVRHPLTRKCYFLQISRDLREI